MASSSESFQVRPARRDDVDTLVAFNTAMAQETEGKALDPLTLRRGVAAVFEDRQRGFYLVAERAGTVVGQLLITTEWSDWRNGYFWWIQSVYVAPQSRRQGVYRALNDAVSRLAQARTDVCGIRLYVERTNYGAQQVYQTLGMSPTSYDLYEIEFPR